MSTAAPTSPSSSRRYVDYDEFIDFQLQKTRAGIKSNDLLTAFIGAAVFVLAYVLVFAAFDHWVIEGGFGRGMRIGLLAALLMGLTGWFVWKLAIPYFRRVTSLYAAKEIEETEPEFHGTLLTLIDLKGAGRTVSPSLRAALEKRAGLGLTHMNVEQAVDRRLLMRLSYILLGLVVVTSLYTVFSPKKLSNSLWRSLLPTSEVAVDTRTRIDRVQPGDVEVLARAQLEVTAELSGELPDEVVLLYSTEDRRLVDEPIVMRETESGLREFRGVITGENARGILQNLTYRITAGDAESETYTVTVTQPPSATVEEVHYEFPAYMGSRDRTQIGGAIDGWEGTWVTIRATANMPVESALVRFSDSDDITYKAEELPVTIANGTQLAARWQLRIRPDGTYPHFYWIQCKNDAGKTDPSPALYPVKIRPDLPPQIQLVQPQSDIERPANAVVPLLYAAQDPDFLLRSVILRLERNGESLPRAPRLFEGPPDRKSVTDSYDFDLSELDLQTGDKLTYWLEARDNMEPFADRAGNRSNTPRLNITITEPAEPEQLQQQLDEDRRQIEERLEEAKQQPSEAGGEPPPTGEDNPDDAPPSPPADASQATDEPPDDADSQDESEQRGQPDGRSQPQPGGESSESTGRQQKGQSSEPAAADAQQQRGEQPSESGEQSDGETEFDDHLLKELMQREQQQAQQREDSGASPDQQAQDRPQQDEPAEGPQQSPSADGAQPGETDTSDADSRQGGQGEQPSAGDEDATTTPDRRPGEGTSPSASPAGEPSTTDPTQPTRPGDPSADQPQPGDGTEPAPDAKNPAVREDNTNGGGPTQDNATSDPDRNDEPEGTDPSSESPNKPGGQANGDPRTPRDASPPDAADRQEGSPPASADPARNSDPTATPEQPPQSPGAPQQPPGAPNDAAPNANRPSGQPSDSGQPGASDSPQQPSAGQTPSGDSQPAGESSQPGQQPPGGQQGGPPSPESGEGAGQPSSGGDAPPSTSDQSDSQPPGSSGESGRQPDGQPPAADESGSPSSGDSPSDGEQPSGQPPGAGGAPPPDQPAGEQPPQGGQPNPGGQPPTPGQGQPQGQPGQGQQPGQPGGAPQPGQQNGPGGQQQGTATSNEGGGSNLGGESDAPSPPVPGGGADGAQQPPGNDGGVGEAATDDNVQGDDPNLEHKKKAAELVLKRLEEQLQRGEIDPQLREEYGVTEEQMQRFTERLRQRLADTGEDQSPEAQARRRQFEDSLRTFEFNSSGTQRAGGSREREASRSFTGPQRTAPLSRRAATRAYQEILSRQRPTD